MDCKKTAERCQGKADEKQPGPSDTGGEEVDPSCLPDSPIVVEFARVKDASEKIFGGIIRTQCKSTHFTQSTGMDIYLKCEFQQHTGSFKERGARYALTMLSDEQKKRGAISASTGNHALAMCYHARELGIPVTVVMPIMSPIMKVAHCRELGGILVTEGRDMTEAKHIAMRMAREQGLTYINGYDHPNVIAGQGTCAMEILEQVPDVDAIICPVGGGGLIAGTCLTMKTLKPDVLIYGVETDCCDSYGNSMREGKPTLTTIKPTLADGLAVAMIGCNSFATAQPHIDKMLAVTEASLAVAILRLIELEKLIVEGAGATGLAAVMSGLVPELQGKKVVLVLTGGNIDTTMLGRTVDRGLASVGRLMRCIVKISDRPGGLAEFCQLVASLGVSIKHVLQQRAWIRTNVYTVETTVICEVKDRAHGNQLKDTLREHFEDVIFVEYEENDEYAR